METIAALLIGTLLGIIIESYLVKKDVLKIKSLNDKLKILVNEQEKEILSLHLEIEEKDEFIDAETDGIEYRPAIIYKGTVTKIWRDINGTRVELECGHTLQGRAFNIQHIQLGENLPCNICLAEWSEKINVKN